MIEVGAMFMGGGSFTLKEFAVAAEATGFDSVWVGDHLAHYVDGVAGLGILAGCTERVTIGTNVIVIPFRPAAAVAKAALTAAASAKRRVVLGVGPGGDVPVEFAMAGATIEDRGRYTNEALDVIRSLWHDHPSSFFGRWSNYEGAVMEPTHGPRPDVWVGGRSEAALQRAVLRGSGYNPYLVSPQQVADRYARLRTIADEHSIGLEGFDFAATTFVVPGRDVDDALERAMPRGGFINMSPSRFRSFYALGGADDVRSRLIEYFDVGTRHLIVGCAPGAPDQLGDFMAMFRELLPELRRWADR